MKHWFRKIANYETEKVSLAALIISTSSFLSFLLGLLRDRLLGYTFGVGNSLDVYYAAFRIPDFVALVLMMGAISVAIIPIFTHTMVEDKQKAFKYLANFLNISLVFLVAVCGILFIASPLLVRVIAPGFSIPKQEATVMLTRIMFLSPILLGISNIISAVLMVFKRFLITSLAPIFYNLGSIIGILFFVPVMGISGLAWGIILGAFLHLIIQLPSLHQVGFRFQPIFKPKDKNFIDTVKLTIPRAIGLTANQVNFIIITAIGSTLLVGSVTIFNWANDLAAPMVGLIAIPFATAVFPALSLAVSKHNHEEFLQKFHLAFRQVIFLIVPASALGFLLRAHLVRIVFGSSSVGWEATRLTAACFGIFMFALCAQGLVYLVSKAFYALKNTFIPTMVSIVSIIILPGLAYYFVHTFRASSQLADIIAVALSVEDIKHFQILGLPLAISIDAVIQIVLLLILLRWKVKDLHFRDMGSFLVKVLGSTIVMLAAAYAARQLFGGFFGGETFLLVFTQTAIVGIVGVMVYSAIAYLLRLPEISTITYFINRFTGVRTK